MGRQEAAAEIRQFLFRSAAMLLLLWVIFGLLFGVTPVRNEDMAPKLSAGDLLLFYRMESDYHSGDVIVFQAEGRQYVGRVAAKGGDTVEITDRAELVINGSMVVENEIYYSTPPYESEVVYPAELAEDEVFVLGDHREGAKDSRYFGPVQKAEIKGKVITVLRRSNI